MLYSEKISDCPNVPITALSGDAPSISMAEGRWNRKELMAELPPRPFPLRWSESPQRHVSQGLGVPRHVYGPPISVHLGHLLIMRTRKNQGLRSYRRVSPIILLVSQLICIEAWDDCAEGMNICVKGSKCDIKYGWLDHSSEEHQPPVRELRQTGLLISA
jgi:hypothetical protein